MYLNKAIIIGNLTRDPELKALPSGSKVCSFSIATNRSWKDKDGAKQESVEFHNVVVFGKVAELCAQYLRKGSQALVEGRIQTRSWDDKDGAKKYRTEIIADTVQFGQRPKNAPGGPEGGEDELDAVTGQMRKAGEASGDKKKGPTPAVIPPGGERSSDDQINYPAEEINPDDIPF